MKPLPGVEPKPVFDGLGSLRIRAEMAVYGVYGVSLITTNEP